MIATREGRPGGESGAAQLAQRRLRSSAEARYRPDAS